MELMRTTWFKTESSFVLRPNSWGLSAREEELKWVCLNLILSSIISLRSEDTRGTELILQLSSSLFGISLALHFILYISIAYVLLLLCEQRRVKGIRKQSAISVVVGCPNCYMFVFVLPLGRGAADQTADANLFPGRAKTWKKALIKQSPEFDGIFIGLNLFCFSEMGY